jgi:4-amino-4-deoxy-L-arabinose transferase-like glycosyltransferase
MGNSVKKLLLRQRWLLVATPAGPSLLSSRSVLAGLLLAALAFRLAHLPAHEIIDTDGVYYALMAENLAHGQGLLPWGDRFYLIWSPLYPVLVAPLYLVLGDSELAGRLVSLAMDLGTVVATWSFGNLAFSPRVGLLAAELVVIADPLIGMSGTVMTEPMYMFFTLCAAYAAFQLYKTHSARHAVVLGLTLAALYLVRPEGLFVAVGMIGLFLVTSLRSRAQPVVWLRAGALVLATFGVALAPYLGYVRAQTGEWALSTKTHNNWYVGRSVNTLDYERIQYGLDPSHQILGTDRFARTSPAAAILADPATFVRDYIGGIAFEARLLALDMEMAAPFVLVGLLTLLRSRKHWPATMLLALLTIPLLVYPAFHVLARTIRTVIPVLCLLAANGLALPWYARLARLRPSALPTWANLGNVAVLGFLLSLLYPIVPDLWTLDDRIEAAASNEYKLAGAALRDQVNQDTLVMARKPWVAYYSGARPLSLPFASLDHTLHYGALHGATLVIIDERLIELRPQLQALVDPQRAPEELQPRLIVDEDVGKMLIVYRLRGASQGP